MAKIEPVEVIYNSACPVCDLGVRNQRRAMERGGAGEIAWTDVVHAPDALADKGIGVDDVRRHLYARDSGGKLHRGADAFALLWQGTPGRRWLGRLIAMPVIHFLATFAYDRFADLLYAWNRRKGRW
jgi:predicted DCC family thiol-disulfide oxidoreductase YuxK